MRLSRNINLSKYKHAWRLVTTVANNKAYLILYSQIVWKCNILQTILISRKSCDKVSKNPIYQRVLLKRILHMRLSLSTRELQCINYRSFDLAKDNCLKVSKSCCIPFRTLNRSSPFSDPPCPFIRFWVVT